MSHSILLGMLGTPELVIILLLLIPILLLPISMWKIYLKANKPGWASIIPIYSILVFLEIIGKPWWWLFLLLIPFLNIIFTIWSWNLLSKSFGKTEGFTFGIILLSIVFIPILAFDSSKYNGPASAKQKVK